MQTTGGLLIFLHGVRDKHLPPGVRDNKGEKGSVILIWCAKNR